MMKQLTRYQYDVLKPVITSLLNGTLKEFNELIELITIIKTEDSTAHEKLGLLVKKFETEQIFQFKEGDVVTSWINDGHPNSPIMKVLELYFDDENVPCFKFEYLNTGTYFTTGKQSWDRTEDYHTIEGHNGSPNTTNT